MTGLAAAITKAAAGPAGNAALRFATVTGYDPATGNVSVDVGGGTLVSCPYLGTYVPTVGDVVAMLSAGPQWLVLGSGGTATPPLTQEYAEVLTQESTSSGSYTSLTTVGPSVTIPVPATGRVLVGISSQIGWVDNTTDGAMGGHVALSMSGANTLAADDNHAARAYVQIGGTAFNVGVFTASRSIRLTGLTQGLTTFALMYKSDTAGKVADFSIRSITVTPY